MAYATQSDIEELYSRDALYVADRDGDGAPDSAAVAKALGAASDEIDTYVGVRYPLPLDGTTPILTQLCVDMALYRLAQARHVLTEEHRTRYEDAIALLTKISMGKATLNLPKAPDPETGEPISTAPRPIVAGGPERLFTRQQMRGL
jgi:phage gp36-like protein